MKLTLYRGLSNIYQVKQIIKELTAGGYSCNSCNNCVCIKYCKSKGNIPKSNPPIFQTVEGLYKEVFNSFKGNQVGNGESLFKVVNIRDDKRYLVEYTTSFNIAKQYGHIGAIQIKIDENYTDAYLKNPGTEQSYFCLSCAPIEIEKYYINMNLGTNQENKLVVKDKLCFEKCIEYIDENIRKIKHENF